MKEEGKSKNDGYKKTDKSLFTIHQKSLKLI